LKISARIVNPDEWLDSFTDEELQRELDEARRAVAPVWWRCLKTPH
jgi:hypothetical protein